MTHPPPAKPSTLKTTLILWIGIVLFLVSIVLGGLLLGGGIQESLARNDPSERGGRTYKELREAKQGLPEADSAPRSATR